MYNDTDIEMAQATAAANEAASATQPGMDRRYTDGTLLAFVPWIVDCAMAGDSAFTACVVVCEDLAADHGGLKPSEGDLNFLHVAAMEHILQEQSR